MKNITLALDEEIIQKGRRYARTHNLTLNSLVRRLLENTVAGDSQNWLDETFRLMDQVRVPRGVGTWRREDLHRV